MNEQETYDARLVRLARAAHVAGDSVQLSERMRLLLDAVRAEFGADSLSVLKGAAHRRPGIEDPAAAWRLVAPAMALTIYFRSDAAAFRSGLLATIQEYLAAWAPSLRWYADEYDGRYQAATPAALARPIARLRDDPRPMPFYSFVAYGGDDMHGCSDVSIKGCARESVAGKLSFIRMTYPLAAYAGAAGAQRFVELATACAQRLPLLHGYGGLTLNQSEIDQHLNSSAAFFLAKRHPGYEIDDCGGTVLVAREAIKGANWLTMLGAPFVERMGGIAALQAHAGPGAALIPLGGGGVIVRACAQPRAGDAAAGDRIPEYGAVSRALSPIRLRQHPDLGPAEFHSFGAEGTARWLHRFD